MRVPTDSNSEWQTQTPVDVSTLKHQLRELQEKYLDLLESHSKIILGMYKYDQKLMGEEYRYAMFSPNNLSRKDIDVKLASLTTPPPFQVVDTYPQ